jgi:hypothetical protein
MQEFSSISVSTYESGSLADRLTEQSADGWSVVAVVPTGSTITAYLSRSSGGSPAAATPHEADVPVADVAEVADVADESTSADPVAEVPGWAAGTADEASSEAATVHVMPDAAGTSTPSDTPADEPAAGASAGAAEAGAAPAGWYADPSSRFELRYWDGTQWTEHVSRAGQQYTDPPVA